MDIPNIVALFRNFFSCLKDLNSTPLPTPSFLPQFFHPDPIPIRIYDVLLNNPIARGLLNERAIESIVKTSILDFIIFLLQAYACFEITSTAVTMFMQYFVDLEEVKLWGGSLDLMQSEFKKTSEASTPSSKGTRRSTRTPTKKAGDKDGKDEETPLSPLSFSLLNQSLLTYKSSLTKNVITSICLFGIGPSFGIISLNSLHLSDPESTFYGGLDCVIFCLSIMEVCLIPLLYFMLLDAFDAYNMWNVLTDLIDDVNDSKKCVNNILNVNDSGSELSKEQCEYYNLVVQAKTMADGRVLDTFATEKKRAFVNSYGLNSHKNATYYPWYNAELSSFKTYDDMVKESLTTNSTMINEIMSKPRPAPVRTVLSYAVGGITKIRLVLLVNIGYVVFNWLAFYGYLVGIVGYFYPAGHWAVEALKDVCGGTFVLNKVNVFKPNWTSNVVQKHPVNATGLVMTNDLSEWSGNFLGDFCWMCEPFFLIFFEWLCNSGYGVFIGKEKTKKKVD